MTSTPGRIFGLPVEQLVGKPGDVYQLGQGVARRVEGGLELDPLGEDRPAGEAGVAAAVVEVKVAVHDQPDVPGRGPAGGQCRSQRVTPRPVVSIDVGVAPHPGVEQQQAVRVIYQVAEAGLDPGAPGARLLRRPHEVTEVDAPHAGVRHGRKYCPRWSIPM